MKQSGVVREPFFFFYNKYQQTDCTAKASYHGIMGHNTIDSRQIVHLNMAEDDMKRKGRNLKGTHSQNSITGDVALGFVMLVAFSP